MKKKSCIYSIAYLTPTPSLYIFGDTTIKTKFGLTISLLVIIVCIIFGVYFLITFFEQKEYTIAYSKDTKIFQKSVDIDDMLFMIGVSGIPNNYVGIVVNYFFLKFKRRTQVYNYFKV